MAKPTATSPAAEYPSDPDTGAAGSYIYERDAEGKVQPLVHSLLLAVMGPCPRAPLPFSWGEVTSCSVFSSTSCPLVQGLR